MIPKKIFFYWGNEKMSWLRYLTLLSFRKFNPDWEITLYVSEQDVHNKMWVNFVEQDYFKYDNGEDFTNLLQNLDINIIKWDINDNKINDSIKGVKMSPPHKSDFLRWEKLYEHGGIFSDLDILYFRPIDNFYEKIKNYDGMICATKHLSIGFLASKPGNTFYKDIFNKGCDTFRASEYQSVGVKCIYDMLKTSRDKVYEALTEQYTEYKFYNKPFHVVYPFVGGYLKSSLNETLMLGYNKKVIEEIPDDTIGFHWYGGHPFSQKLNNLLNEQSYNDYDNIITDLINKFEII